MPLTKKNNGGGNSPVDFYKEENITNKIEKKQVSIHGDYLILNDFVVTGIAHAVISEGISQGKDPEDCVLQILDLGASVLKYGNSRATVDSISSEIERIVNRLQYVTQNEYSQILNQHKSSLDEALSQFLDPGRSSSVQMQIQSLIKDSGLNAQQAFSAVLNDQNGPFATLRNLLDSKIGNIEVKQVDILKDLSAISERLKMKETLEAAYQKSTSKGFDHEASILEIVEGIVSPLKDQLFDVSKEIGLRGTKKGDALVKLNEDETNGLHTGYVIEAKDQKLNLNAALKELELGMANRGVKTGILVFASKDQLPTNGSSLRLYSGNRILVSLSEGSNNLELEIACSLARGIALQESKLGSENFDIKSILEKVDKLSNVLDEARDIEKGTALAKKGIDVIEASYKKLRTDALDLISDIQVR